MMEKIRPDHLSRKAYVYVRQSSWTQVQENVESQRRQYALADRAHELGWREVETIDEDLGRSGGAWSERPGSSAW
jgi:DNA invertase Pin-like site-specific DNA recombinase